MSNSSSSSRPPQSDEEIANALQTQYRQEFLQRQARRNARSRASAPPAEYANSTSTSWSAPPPTAPPARTPSTVPLIHVPVVELDDTPSPQVLDDDLRIAQELQDEELARRLSRMSELQSTSSSTSSSRLFPSAFLDERSSSFGTNSNGNNNDDPDMAHARRIAQEMHDAEMAQRLSVYEQEALQRLEREQRFHGGPAARTPKSALSRILPLLCCGIAISIPVLFILGVFDGDDASDFFGDLGDAWIDTDPWKGESATDPGAPDSASGAFRWSTNGVGGLSLTILNAMEDSWEAELRTAVNNWEAGVPVDPLSLQIERTSYDYACSAVDGKLKICNGDYGATRWRGINEVVLNKRTNTIVSSAARMNEYYLPNGGKAEQRLYTLCHELGHGFGLPHWDEDFYNEDLGNCMDYTSRPQNNMQPDAANFLYLGELYGNGTVTAALNSQVVAQQQEDDSTSDAPVAGENGKNGGKNGKNGNRKQRERVLRGGGRGRRRGQTSSSSTATGTRGATTTATDSIPEEPSRSLSSSSNHNNNNNDGNADVTLVHPQDDGTSRLLVANDRIQVHYRELEESPHLIHVYQYLLE